MLFNTNIEQCRSTASAHVSFNTNTAQGRSIAEAVLRYNMPACSSIRHEFTPSGGSKAFPVHTIDDIATGGTATRITMLDGGMPRRGGLGPITTTITGLTFVLRDGDTALPAISAAWPIMGSIEQIWQTS